MIRRKAILMAGVDWKTQAFQDPDGNKWARNTNDIMLDDVRRFESYLKTDLGGGWNSDEIFSIQCNSNDANECYRRIAAILDKSCDYLLFYCIAHGCIGKDDHQGVLFYVEENHESEVFWIEWLNILVNEHNVSSHLFLINSCRTDSDTDPVHVGHYIVSLDSFERYSDNDKAYTKALTILDKEKVTVFSTRKGSVAIFSNTGAYFSESLFTAIEAWAGSPNSDNILTISAAIAITNQFMKKHNQKAEILISHGDISTIPIAAKS
jgi:hypothetical protein